MKAVYILSRDCVQWMVGKSLGFHFDLSKFYVVVLSVLGDMISYGVCFGFSLMFGGGSRVSFCLKSD